MEESRPLVGTEVWALRYPMWRHESCELEWTLLLKNMFSSLAPNWNFQFKISVIYWGILYSTLCVTLHDSHCTVYISRTIFVPCLPMIKQVTYQLKQSCYISKITIIFNNVSFMNMYEHGCPALHIILCSNVDFRHLHWCSFKRKSLICPPVCGHLMYM